MTLATLLADVYRRCGYAASPATDVATRITAFVNETQQDILAEPGMQWLLNDQITLASVAAQAEYALPQTVLRIKAIRDYANRRTLHPMSLTTYRERYPDPTTDSGTPAYYIDLGMSPVIKQPSTGTQLTVVSTAAGDTTQNIHIQGFLSNTDQYPYSVLVALNGTTPVNIPTATTTLRITKWWSSAALAGLVFLKEGTTTIGALVSTYLASGTSPHYRNIAFAPTPAAALTYYIDYERTTNDLAISTDEPLLPPQFHRLLAIGARVKEYEKQNQMNRLGIARAEYVLGLKQLKYWVYTNIVGSPNMRASAGYSERDSAVNVTTS